MDEELEILLYGSPMLRQVCRPVERFDDELRTLADRMARVMGRGRGIGLAAPQVGVDLRMLLAHDGGAEGPRVRVFANPEITFASTERDRYCEGCLSLPQIYEDIVRPVRIRVRYQDLDGAERELEDDGMLARIVQHEADHLEGVLMIDHLSLLRRRLLARKLKDLSRRSEAR